ncbi:cell adhesion molecule-related/down-regulated by oncogenes-like [Amphibalanus amphitrite]|uniref:cell adhesion molecule-related/down-regulated by oncogenes-like n=1 Tax=Amphibalanus amphitrite TaxID=1232801 RepID=UPI001C91ED11|nr:cell adhesion molecule-related/down-regulated by oncogenes-like [Amphibalanus amphitrite]
MCVLRHLVLMLSVSRTSAQKDLGIFFVEEPQSALVSPGEEVVLSCAINLPVDQLRWLHNWRPLPAGDGGAVKVQPGRLRLQTKGELGEHGQLDGEYRCMAWMAPIGLASLPAVVTVAHLGQFVARPNATVTAPTGGTVLLRCPPPESAPPAEIRFYRDGEALISDGDSHQLLSGGRLFISNVSSSQAGTLECAADGWPVPTVAWHRSTLGARWSERFSQGAAALTIRQLKVEDEGTFICEVVSEAGVVTRRHRAPVSVWTSPTDLSVPEGAAVELLCSGRGWPPPELTWVFNGRPVPSTEPDPETDTAREPESAQQRETGAVSGRKLETGADVVPEDGQGALAVAEGQAAGAGSGRNHVRRRALKFRAVRRQDAGLYQCFGHGANGDDKAAVLLKS